VGPTPQACLISSVCGAKENTISRSLVTIYSHENQTSYSSLEEFDKDEPVSSLLAKFRRHGWGSKKNLEERKIWIRFVVFEDAVVRSPPAQQFIAHVLFESP
jgi:hypothetical protein